MVIVVMGPAGAGKSDVGELLAEHLGWPLVDDDGSRTASYVAPGVTSDDAHRSALPAGRLAHLRRLATHAVDRRESLILVCPLLTAADRTVIAEGLRSVRFVYLSTTADGHPPRSKATKRPTCAITPERRTASSVDVDETTLTLDGNADPTTIVGRVRLALGV